MSDFCYVQSSPFQKNLFQNSPVNVWLYVGYFGTLEVSKKHEFFDASPLLKFPHCAPEKQNTLASGIRHAQWVSATTRVIGDGAAAPALRRVVMPAIKVQIHDNWQVMGLQGTGSCDFAVTDLFVPESFSWDVQRARPQRGGPLYRLGMPAFVANEHVAFALGVGWRALDTLLDLASSKQRGYGPRSTLAARPALQRAVGQSELRLRAVRALAIGCYEQAWTIVCAGQTLPPRLQAELRSVATFATEVAVDVTTQAFRYSGGTALYMTHVLQRCLRDINAAAQHLMVSDAAYENYGQCLLGLPDADPMR